MGAKGAFEADTQYRMVVELARYWVIEHDLRTGDLPPPATFYCYPNGPMGFDWGDAPGSKDADRPLRRKRVKVTFEIEDVS